jgi:hypothetical protein
MADQMALLARMQSLPPSQWTPEMKALDTQLKTDPTLKQELGTRLREAKAAEGKLGLGQQSLETTSTIEKTGSAVSVTNGADVLAQPSGSPGAPVPAKPIAYVSSVDEPPFPSAPDLGEQYRAALVAKEPLDTPTKVAALTPPTAPAPASPGGGFDV